MKKDPTLLSVRVYGDDILRQKTKPVEHFDEELRSFAADLIFTMYQRDGVGLAATQVGRDISVFAIDTEWSKDDAKPHPIVMINPQIISTEGEIEYEEGCISVPGIYAKVRRPSKIRYGYYDLEAKYHEEEAEDFKAVVIQHENDHLNGTLFIDHLSSLMKLRLKLKLKEISKTAVDGINIRHDIFVAED